MTPPSFYGLEVGRNFDVALPLCSEPVLHGEGGWNADSTTWWLSGFYGVLADVLAIVGIYGIISNMVIRRRNEIGVRIALGANKVNVLGLILREALALLAIGLIVGTCLTAAARSAARAMLFGLKPVDPLTLVLAAGGLTIIAVAASAIPAARAAGVDPIQVLREE